MDFSILIQFGLLILGFVLLIKGSDFFVDGSSNIASILKIPTIIVGLTIVAFGTSAPEAAVSITSSISGNNAMAVSNVIGSNLFNILLIIGICATLRDLNIGRKLLEKDLPFLVVITILVSAFILIGWEITRLEGILLLFLIIGYVSYLVYTAKNSVESNYVSKPTLSPIRSVIYIILGFVGIVLGGNFVVNSASNIALSFGMSETLVGLTIVAVGTSLPELVTSLSALKRDENEIIIGNVVGSNIFNILFVLGSSSTINPITLSPSMLIDILLMVGVTILCYIFAKTQDKFDKKEGIILVALFFAYMAFAIMRN